MTATTAARSVAATDGPPLTGRVALVTGGARGIGAAVSRALGEAGATVAVNYRSSEEQARGIAAELAGSAWQADVADARASRDMVAGVADRHGRIDVVVVNAGVHRGARVDELEPGDWRAVLAASLDGAFHVIRQVVPHMRRQRWGRIIVNSSAVGLVGFPGDAAYASAKAGLFGLVRSVAKECGRHGITVNAVAPGLIETDMTAGLSDRAREQMLARTAVGRSGETEDVAAAVRYLACEASYVTGQVLVVDGGFSL